MCGLSGIYAYALAAAPVDRNELARINGEMIARGPDGDGFWYSDDGTVGLAHRRLAIIDLRPTGAQPMATPDGRYHITYNGEIYNFRGLRDELEADGISFRGTSDTEVLLHLYAREGAEMITKLRGMYAIAIWDSVKQGLFLARDAYGIKPLYYADQGGQIRFASQVKALLAGGGLRTSLDPAGQVGFYLFGYVPEPHTLHREITLLPAGHTLWIDANGVGTPKPACDITRFFSGKERNPTAPLSRAELGEHIRDTITHHLVSDVPVGVFLSSGLDSATIAAWAQAISQGSSSDKCQSSMSTRLKTFTLGFEEYKGTPRDEVPLAETIAQTYGTDHSTRWVRASEFKDQLSDVFDAMDQPSIDGVNTYFVSKACAETGLKVALSGLGGDELLGGYDTFQKVPQVAGTFAHIPFAKPLGKLFRMISRPVLDKFTSPKYAGLLELGSDVPGAYLLRRGVFMPWELPDYLDGDLVREGWQALQPLIRLDADQQGIGRDAQKVGVLESAWYMRNQLLRDSDWAGMAHSLEIRVPLVDPVLGQALGPYLGTGLNKRDMAETPPQALPDAVLNRPKTGFMVPVNDWVRGEAGDGAAASRGYRPWLRKVAKSFNI